MGHEKRLVRLDLLILSLREFQSMFRMKAVMGFYENTFLQLYLLIFIKSMVR